MGKEISRIRVTFSLPDSDIPCTEAIRCALHESSTAIPQYLRGRGERSVPDHLPLVDPKLQDAQVLI